MKMLFVLLASLALHHTALPQQVTITISNIVAGKAHLSALSGEKTRPVDTISSVSDGTFRFQLASHNPPGVYRLSFDRNRWVDFIHENEEVSISTDGRAIDDSLKVHISESNRLYYAFHKLNRQFKTKSDLLQLVLARYPQDDPYYATTLTTVAQLQGNYAEFVIEAVRTKPHSFIARYIRSSQHPVVNLSDPAGQQLAHLKSHALDSVDFSDAGLVNSDLFTKKSIEYLMYYRNPQLPKELLAREFNAAVDSILNKAKVNQVVYKHITEYLIEGFKQFGFEECINYILDNYVIKDDLCLDQTSGSSIQRMIDQKKYLPIGARAPEIILPDTSGNPVSMKSMKAGNVLIVFYTTGCPHCQTMIPELSTFVKNRGGDTLSVLAISLDENRDDWLKFVRTNRLTWTNVVDSRGWQGQAAQDYFVYATPTMILVNKEKKIIAKPLTVEELVLQSFQRTSSPH